MLCAWTTPKLTKERDPHPQTGECVYEDCVGAIRLVEMLFSTSLLVIVGAGEQAALSPRRVSVVSAHERRVIADLYLQEAVTSIKLSRARLVVLTRAWAHVYALATLQRLDSFATALNPRGVCALSQSATRPLLAVPGSSTAGIISVYAAGGGSAGALLEVSAHRTPLVALAFNTDGTLLASASDKGTVVRVHSLPPAGSGGAAAQVHAFRRGLSPNAIHSLWFSAAMLLASSDGGTVHVFKVTGLHGQQSGAHQTANSYAGAAISAACAAGGAFLASLVPKRLRAPVADAVHAHRAEVTLRGIAPAGVRTSVALAPEPSEEDGVPSILVASYQGVLTQHAVTAPLEHTLHRWGGTSSTPGDPASSQEVSHLVRETALLRADGHLHGMGSVEIGQQHASEEARWLSASAALASQDGEAFAADLKPQDLTSSLNVSLQRSIML